MNAWDKCLLVVCNNMYYFLKYILCKLENLRLSKRKIIASSHFQKSYYQYLLRIA